jgi:hypothetical protein
MGVRVVLDQLCDRVHFCCVTLRRDLMHWYVAKAYIGDLPLLERGQDDRARIMSGAGESPQDAIEDMGIDADTIDQFTDIARTLKAKFWIEVIDTFKYERIIYLPEEES